MTWAVEWRMMPPSASSLLAVTISTDAPSQPGRVQVGERAVDLAAASAVLREASADGGGVGDVAPSASSLPEPSGSTMFMMVPFLCRARTKRLHDRYGRVLSAQRAMPNGRKVFGQYLKQQTPPRRR